MGTLTITNSSIHVQKNSKFEKMLTKSSTERHPDLNMICMQIEARRSRTTEKEGFCTYHVILAVHRASYMVHMSYHVIRAVRRTSYMVRQRHTMQFSHLSCRRPPVTGGDMGREMLPPKIFFAPKCRRLSHDALSPLPH